jgi:hypothetical protein
MIDASQRMIRKQNNPATNRQFELEIKTLLQNAPIDAGKVEFTFKNKKRQKQEAMQMEDTQRLVREEIEMLQLYCIWS